MIKEKETAKMISELMLEYGKKIDESILLVQKKCTKPEFDSYRKAAGRVMAEMLLGIMNPIYKEHPDIKPKELD